MPLLCVGARLIGLGLLHAQNYRFGFELCAPDPAKHPVASSWVLAGGVAGAVIGPEHELTAAPFAGVFLLCTACFGLVLLVLLLGQRARVAPSSSPSASLSWSSAEPLTSQPAARLRRHHGEPDRQSRA